jgi:hypothetical protein
MRASRSACLVVLALAICLAGSARADLIFLKDGYVVQGTVRREMTSSFDHVSKEMTLIPKGFFMIDDGPRRVYFSPTQVRIIEKLPAPTEERVVSTKGAYIMATRPMPPIEEVLEVGPWDYKTWRREYLFLGTGTPSWNVRLVQGLATIDPYFARVDAVTKFPWSSAYLTREWDPETVYKLLLGHPDFQEPPVPTIKSVLEAEKRALDIMRRRRAAKGKPDEKPKEPPKELTPEEKLKRAEEFRERQIVAQRMRLCDFFAQAGWFHLADRELDRLLKDRPGEKERVASAREKVDKLRVRDLWEQTKKWYHGGRYNAVRKRLGEFSTKKVPDRIQADIREIRARLDSSAALIDEANDALQKCSKAVTTAEGRALASAVNVLRTELHPATIDRLDAFLGQMRDRERQQTRGKKATQTPESLLSLAITGWLLGSPSAEAMPQVAVNLWKTRQMVLEYLQESDANVRQKILADYERTIPSRVELDEIAQLIEHLPPVEPVRATPGITVERQVGRGRSATTYSLRLPPEYSPSKQYPVLLVLSKGGRERPEEMIDRWAEAAADHGYILAAPKWHTGLTGIYGYSEKEHDAVIDTLRDLRRCCQIDSDRVFLFGLAEGAKMCFDVGLAHPHLFAGILPMGAGPNYYARRYWRNAQYLPVYAVNGTRAGESNTLLREQFEHWAIRGYPTLWIEYKGRGIEWLGGEVPNMFDWMRNQRRAFPMRQLGTDGVGTTLGNEFCTMRAEDNRFYWLSTTSISPRYTVTAGRWSNLVEPAAMTGRIDPQSNDVTLKTQGLGQISIWFGRNSKGQYMIDFDKPVTVRVGLRVYVIKRKVVPSLAVLLEDLWTRGDRKQLFVAHIDVNLR